MPRLWRLQLALSTKTPLEKSGQESRAVERGRAGDCRFRPPIRKRCLPDCDVDAADLHLLLQPTIQYREEFRSGKAASYQDGMLAFRQNRRKRRCQEEMETGPCRSGRTRDMVRGTRPGAMCVSPKCGTTVQHQAGVPCNSIKWSLAAENR